MTLYLPPVDVSAFDEYAYEVTTLQNCGEREQQEVMQYARVLCARGLAPEHIIEAVARYAKIRSDNNWY